MTNIFHFIARDDALQQRLVDEMNATFPGKMDGDWVPSTSDLVNMPFLNAVMREVMRVRPTSSTGLERVTPPESKVVAGTFVPGGTIVSMPTCGLMHDDRIFDHPEKFDPEIWLGPESGKLLKYFLPISTGLRACIGRNFAVMQILKALVVVLKLFQLKRVGKKETVVREGFFTEAAEYKVTVTRRD
ncbi:hypothetical protein MBLNU13_g00853t2 [Cladosporium sp. NU13]